MYKEWNILTLQAMLKNDKYTPLKKYFIWELLKELKNE